jgi:hypothetical protein
MLLLLAADYFLLLCDLDLLHIIWVKFAYKNLTLLDMQLWSHEATEPLPLIGNRCGICFITGKNEFLILQQFEYHLTTPHTRRNRQKLYTKYMIVKVEYLSNVRKGHDKEDILIHILLHLVKN